MAKKDLSIKPSLTSKDGYILDGHHRWLVDHNKGQKHHTVTVDLPIKDLIHRAHSYGKSFTKSITEQRLEIIRGTITEATKKAKEAYGWFNDKGTFLRNRSGIHGENYKQKAKHLTVRDKRMLDDVGYDATIAHALRHKWVRADVSPETRHDTKERALYGVLQYKNGSWTPRHEKNLKRIKKAIGLPHDAPEDVTHIEESTKANNAYGWFNDKGTFLRNRGGIHGETYREKAKHLTASDKRTLASADYDEVIDHALKNKWVRADVSTTTDKIRNEKKHVMFGVLQHKKGAWTPRHEKNYNRIKKAIGVRSDTHDDVERIEESTTHGWIDPDGKWHGTTPTLKLHYDVYMKHLLKHKPDDYEKLKATAKSNWRQGNGIAIQHAKRNGWLHTYIDDDGYGMIAGKKSQFNKHRKVIDGIKQKYSKHDVTHIHESHE